MKKKWLCKALAVVMALTTVMAAASPALAAEAVQGSEEEIVGEGIVGPVNQEDCKPDEEGRYKVEMSVSYDTEVPSGINLPQPSISHERALPGETIWFDPGMAKDWTCERVFIVVEPQGGGIHGYQTTETSFKMPAAKVCVNFDYKYQPHMYSITLEIEDTIYDLPIPTLDRVTAAEGDTVTINTDDRNGYYYNGAEITETESGREYRIKDSTFTMPASDIIVKPLYATIGIPPIMRGSFYDMKDPKNAYYKAVYWSVSADVLDSRHTDGNFGINDKCTRGTAVFALWRMSNRLRPDLNGKLNFPDVPADHEYYRAILWAYQKGIAKGYKDGTFGINKNVTRGEFIMMLWRYMGSPQPKAVSKAPFKDVAKTNAFYKATLWAYQNGVAKGYKDGTFGVNKAATKADMALLMFRTLPDYMRR